MTAKKKMPTAPGGQPGDKRHGRSALSNGTKLFDADGRSKQARRLKDGHWRDIVASWVGRGRAQGPRRRGRSSPERSDVQPFSKSRPTQGAVRIVALKGWPTAVGDIRDRANCSATFPGHAGRQFP
jgi:hypothetical protein